MTKPGEIGRAPTEAGTAVVVALGSNLGDRLEHLRGGLAAMGTDLVEQRLSSIYESNPVGLEEQPLFLNAVVLGRTGLSPLDLLVRLQAIETAAGRARTRVNGPRTLDLDLVFYGQEVIESARLRTPHPRWLQRSFVRVPILEVDPAFVDPITGASVSDLSRGRSVLGLRWYAPPTALETPK